MTITYMLISQLKFKNDKFINGEYKKTTKSQRKGSENYKKLEGYNPYIKSN